MQFNDKMCVLRNILIVILCAFVSTNGQNPTTPPNNVHQNPHNGLTEKIGNFSIELLYHTSKLNRGNLIMSPITTWTVLAVISEGAINYTQYQINRAIRISDRHKTDTRVDFQNIFRWLQVNTSTVELAKVNAIFIDQKRLLLRDFQDVAETVYQTKVIPLNFTDSQTTADIVNRAISTTTHGKIPKLLDGSDLRDTPMILTSALYFKGQWTVPFNRSSTTTMPFYNSSGQKTGEVKMMYNRYNFPFANIKELQARVIELPYGKEDRLSMLIMLPNPDVSLHDMFLNFANVPLDTLFSEMRVSKEEYGDDEVDCYIPRFKIKSDLDLTEVLRNQFGIEDLFDVSNAKLPYMARTPMYVSKIIQKAEIEVTEDGTTAAAVTAAEFSNRIGIVQFVANRPFCYIIVEKVTNSIVFGGLYEEPSIY